MATQHVRGANLFYAEQGAGPSLVLLHGFPLDHRVWDAQQAKLSDACRVITPDLRGFGRSNDEHPFTMESLADDVHALLEALGALPCVLGGLSMGGYVALAYARKYAEELRGLVLIDTRAESDSPEGKAGRQKMIDLALSSGGAKAVADQMMPKMLHPTTQVSDVARRLRGIMEDCPPITIANALGAMRDRPDMTGFLPSIKLPTLILVGDSDAITPPAMAETMHKAIVNSTLDVIDEAGHMACMEQPPQVNESLRRFISHIGAS